MVLSKTSRSAGLWRVATSRMLGACVLVACASGACEGLGKAPSRDARRALPARPEPAIPADWGLAAEVVTAEHGMVVSADGHASRVGRDVLAAGGNAVDAVVATAFALAVTYPRAGNLGGGGFMVVRLADGTVAALDFRETAPAAATRAMYLDENGKLGDASLYGNLAWGVPGSVAGLWEAHQRFGSRPWAELLAPAIALARDGVPVTPSLGASVSRMWERMQQLKQRDPDVWARHISSSAHFWSVLGPQTQPDGLSEALSESSPETSPSPHGKPPLWFQPDLARTLTRIAEQGPDDFYRGKTAQLILEEQVFGGGVMTAEDLDGYRAEWREPLVFEYRGHRIVSMPPASSGGATMAQMAQALEGDDLGALGFGSAATVHLMAEVMKRAYADRNTYLGDPDFVSMPLERLTSRAYAEQRRAEIRLDRATPAEDVGPGLGDPMRGDNTTHVSIVDGQGNAVSLTTTLNTSFGSHVVIGMAGFLMNNEMDDFAARPGHPNTYGLVQGEINAIEPGKRMLSSMTPSIVLDPQGDLFLVTGTPGGSRIINVVFQTISNALDHGMDLGRLISAPRIHHQHLPDLLYFEAGGLEPSVVAALEGLGHELRARSPICDVQAIMLMPDGTRLGAADPRGAGLAAGY